MVIPLKLIINVPTDKDGINLFRKEFAKLQMELVLFSIRSLNISIEDREKILQEFTNKIKERLVD